jgi:hypothetical protein
LALDELEHPAGVSGARKVFRIDLRMKNASIINGRETHQFKGVKGHRDRPWIKHSVGVEFQAFESDRDREKSCPPGCKTCVFSMAADWP